MSGSVRFRPVQISAFTDPGLEHFQPDHTNTVRVNCSRRAGAGLRLLDIASEDAILVSLAIVGLSSSGQLSCGSLGEEPCETVVWSLSNCLVLSVKKGIRTGPSK